MLLGAKFINACHFLHRGLSQLDLDTLLGLLLLQSNQSLLFYFQVGDLCLEHA